MSPSPHLSAAELAAFAQKLQQRSAVLGREIRETRARRADERYDRVAGEAPDTEDAALADVVRDLSNAEISRDANELSEVNQALERIATGTFGVCLRCGEPIERERLEAHPAARRHVRCQEIEDREREQIATPSL